MGCGLSRRTNRPMSSVRVNILDADFFVKQNDKVRQKMDKLSVKYESYVSLQKMVENMKQLQYRNVVITTEEFFPQVMQQLRKVKLCPNIFVKFKHTDRKQSTHYEHNDTFHVQYFKSYDELISLLSNRTQEKVSIENKPKVQNNDSHHVVLKILRQPSIQSQMQLKFMIELLKSKGISFSIYHSFLDFQKSLTTITSDFVVCDYQYHRQVLNIVPDPFQQTRVICVCQFARKQTYDPRVYFMTDNWIEIVNEIGIQQKWSHLNLVKCSKVFMYSQNEKFLAHYAQTIETLGFQVRIYSDLNKIMSESKYYFAISIIVSTQDQQLVEQYLSKNDFLFKTKIITIQQQTQNSIKSLHKILLQLKRGYRGQKSITRSIDIIDKHFANGKYSAIRQQFSKFKVLCCLYSNIDEYISTLKYMSPYVIVNEEESGLLLRYMREVRASSKVILFCRRHNTMSQIKNEHAFCFVNDHFGKIVSFVKSNHVYNPVIPDLKRVQMELLNEGDDFAKVDPTEIQHEDTDLQSYKITKYTTACKKSHRRSC